VSQKKDIQRQKGRLESLKQEAEDEKARAKEAARERVLLDFEKGQLRLAGTPGATTATGSGANLKSSGNTDEREYSKARLCIWWSQCYTIKQGERNANSNSMLPQLKHSPGKPRRQHSVT
jgi:hypothetical protein